MSTNTDSRFGTTAGQQQGTETPGTATERTRATAGSAAESTRTTASSTAERAREAASEAGHRVGEAAERARAGVDRMTRSARERLGRRSDEARGRRGRYGVVAREGSARAREGFGQMLHDHPFVLAALGLAIGAAIGASLPSTRREDEVIGDYRDDLLHRAQRLGRESLDRVVRMAERAQDAAISEAARQGLTPSEVRRRGEEAFRAAGEEALHAAQETARRRGGEAMHTAEEKAKRVVEAARDAAKEEYERPRGEGQQGRS